MTKMNIMAAVGASALMITGAMAAPASAQSWRDRGDAHHNYDARGGNLTTSYVDSLEWRINNSPISRGERRALLREWHEIQPLAWRVQTGRASRWEHNRLATGVRRIEQATRHASVERYDRRGDDRRGRYGYNRY